VTPTGGDFELRISRPSYGEPAEIVQVDAQTGEVLRELPSSVLRGWRGLRRFFEVTVSNRAGNVVATRHFRFCPNAVERQATGDIFPPMPRYPDKCPSGSPFVRGMVWGLDSGWATTAFSFFSEYSTRRYAVELPEGSYTATVRIAPLYRSLLGVPADKAEVAVNFTVERAPASRRALDRHTAAGSGPPAEVPPTMDDPDPRLLPDLVALPAWNVELIEGASGKNLLTFAASPWNAGPAPLVVEGFRRPDSDVADAYQSFYDGETAVGRTRAGTIVFDSRQGHNHWHFLQFSRYSLISRDRGLVMRSRKQSFCLAATEAIDLTVPGASWTPGSLTFTSVCGARNATWLREAMPAGWADTYFQTVAGQAFDVTSVPNGRYWIEIKVNPLGLLHERSRSNNVARRTIVLEGTKADRRVKVLPWRTIVS
jgi:hypothetical protein